MAISAGITIEEFERLPDALVCNRELVNGELVDVSGNTPSHNRLRDLLILMLRPRVEGPKLGMIIAEQEFEFDQNAHGPDVAFISAAKIHLIDWKKRVQRFVPDLAIEIVSQNDTFKNLMKKAVRYRKCGTSDVWVLSPDTRQAFVLSEERRVILEGADVLESELIPGFSIRLGELFDSV